MGRLCAHLECGRAFREGFVAMMPLWLGAVPSGVAFGVAARAVGMPAGEAQLMSLLVFSAPAQMMAVGSDGQPALLLVVTAMTLNAHLPLLGAVVARSCAPRWRQRLPLAWLLTDGSFAVAMTRGRRSLPGLAGAGASMFVAWNAGTALGLTVGGALPAPWRTGIDLVVPLTFVAVLAPLLRTRLAVAVALVAAAIALLASRFLPAGATILLSGTSAALLGAWRWRGA